METSTLISSVSLAVCSILSTLTGCILATHRSKCTLIEMPCITCHRSIPPEDTEELPV